MSKTEWGMIYLVSLSYTLGFLWGWVCNTEKFHIMLLLYLLMRGIGFGISIIGL